jgi:hypothetical protein
MVADLLWHQHHHTVSHKFCHLEEKLSIWAGKDVVAELIFRSTSTNTPFPLLPSTGKIKH